MVIFVKGLCQNIALENGEERLIFRNFVWRFWTKIMKVALAKCFQRHSFGADYTIIQLPTDAQHAKDGCCGKN